MKVQFQEEVEKEHDWI